MLSQLIRLAIGDKFKLIKIPLAKSEGKKVRSYDLGNLKVTYPFLKLELVFVFTKFNWLIFDNNSTTLNVFNESVTEIFTVWSTVYLIEDDPPVKDDDEISIVAQYIGSYIFLERGFVQKAFNMIVTLSDILLSRLVFYAHGFDDRNFALNQLRFAIFCKEGRYIEGKGVFFPKVNQIDCIFDLLKFLMQDKEAVFYPYHPNGRFDSYFVEGKNSHFICRSDIEVPFNQLRWSPDKVDLFINTKVYGYIDVMSYRHLDHDIVSGLPNQIETYTTRQFHFIKNGISENTKVYIKASSATTEALIEQKILQSDESGYFIDFSEMPLLGCKLYTETKLTGPEMFVIIEDSIKYKKRYYSLRYIKMKLFSTTFDSFSQTYQQFTLKEKKYLESLSGLTEKGYPFHANPIRRGSVDISFYISDREGELELSKLAYIIKEPITDREFKPEELKSTYEKLDMFSFQFFDYIDKNPSKTLDDEIENCLQKIVELDYLIQFFRMLCITSSWWSEVLEFGVRGYKCEKGDLVFTEEHLYA
jgi:hypothetical protein